MRLSMIIEETVGQHDVWHYREFLELFYDEARRNNEDSLLNKGIAEIAATAAALK